MTFSRPFIFFFLLTAATLFASNHIAARIAFDDGTGLVLALVSRSMMACLLMLGFALVTKQSFRMARVDLYKLILLGLLISVQSFTLYSAVARLPVAVALLLVNTWPVLYITIGWFRGRSAFRSSLLTFMLVILAGLALVLNLPALFGDQVFDANWWSGIALGVTSAVFLSFAMWLTNYHMAHVSGSVRSFYTMLIVVVSLNILGLTGLLDGSYTLPASAKGYIGLGFLALFYGIASTMLFAYSPRLDLAKNSPLLNFEPVASLFLGFIFLGQFLSLIQLVGGLLVVAGIVAIGLLK
jgi:drug/metabolite transporter (DMT)-like permease